MVLLYTSLVGSVVWRWEMSSAGLSLTQSFYKSHCYNVICILNFMGGNVCRCCIQTDFSHFQLKRQTVSLHWLLFWLVVDLIGTARREKWHGFVILGLLNMQCGAESTEFCLCHFRQAWVNWETDSYSDVAMADWIFISRATRHHGMSEYLYM